MVNCGESKCAPNVSLDVALSILASEHRRHVLRQLLAAPVPSVEVSEIVDRIADDVGTDRGSLEIDLTHNDIPRMDDAGVVEFDRRSGAVRRTEAVEEFEPFLELCEQWAP